MAYVVVLVNNFGEDEAGVKYCLRIERFFGIYSSENLVSAGVLVLGHCGFYKVEPEAVVTVHRAAGGTMEKLPGPDTPGNYDYVVIIDWLKWFHPDRLEMECICLHWQSYPHPWNMP